ncbi:MAG: peptidylprolyl isomerase [Betaproteobacteria bacterium]|nr:MAG: peptidylprolyl isomerase [Betaproteobacteria bacterium]
MKIEKDRVVTMRFKASELGGKVLEDGKTSMAYLHGGYSNVLPKIEEALEGQSAGFEVTLELQPKDAFGERDEKLVQTISKSQFPPGVKVGGQLRGRDMEGNERVFTVKKIKGQEVFLDGNHPLAGVALRFEVTVDSVRAATEEEIAHGHAHGEDGHNH